MLSIINCITEPYLLQSYIFAYIFKYIFPICICFCRLKGNSPCPGLFLCQTSGRSPGLWFILRTPSRFRSDFLSFVPNIIIRHFYYPGQSHNYSRGSCGGFSPHFPDGFHHVFLILNRLFSRCCKFSVELLKGYHFFNDLATPFFQFSGSCLYMPFFCRFCLCRSRNNPAHITTDTKDPPAVASPIGNNVSGNISDVRYTPGTRTRAIETILWIKEYPDRPQAQK